MNFRHYLTFLLIWASVYSLQAQIPNQVLEDKIILTEADSGYFGFSLVNTPYMRNTEYFNPIEEGRTLFGYQLQPKLFYQPTSQVKLEAGVWLRNDFGGNSPYTSAIPTFSLKAKRKQAEIIFGTLEGALSHRMLEPMMNIQSVIDRRIENGFQFKIDRQEKYWLDLWINWEDFIEPGALHKEKFTAGIHERLKIGKHFTGYLQGMASHQGGQIDADTLDPFMMQFNLAYGLKFQSKLNENYHWNLDAAFLQYLETSDSKVYPKGDGLGLLLNAGISSPYTHLILSYWYGENFIAPRGTFIYQSQSTVDPKNYEKNRQLVFFRFIKNKPLFQSPVMASIRFEPVLDVNHGILDFSYSLYLVYKGSWRFGKK